MKGKLTNNSSRDSLNKQYTNPRGGNKMKAKFKKMMKNQKGMTLIELLAVIVIIAIIALIAIPAIGNIISNSKDKAILADAQNIVAGAKIAAQDGVCKTDGTICDSSSDLKKYVEIDNGGTYGVKITNTDGTVTYELYYSKFGDVKKKEFADVVGGATTDAKTVNISDVNELLK